MKFSLVIPITDDARKRLSYFQDKIIEQTGYNRPTPFPTFFINLHIEISDDTPQIIGKLKEVFSLLDISECKFYESTITMKMENFVEEKNMLKLKVDANSILGLRKLREMIINKLKENNIKYNAEMVVNNEWQPLIDLFYNSSIRLIDIARSIFEKSKTIISDNKEITLGDKIDVKHIAGKRLEYHKEPKKAVDIFTATPPRQQLPVETKVTDQDVSFFDNVINFFSSLGKGDNKPATEKSGLLIDPNARNNSY